MTFHLQTLVLGRPNAVSLVPFLFAFLSHACLVAFFHFQNELMCVCSFACLDHFLLARETRAKRDAPPTVFPVVTGRWTHGPRSDLEARGASVP